MNLNYDPTPEALTALIGTASPISVHNLAIDFDGEVIIDPEMYYENVPLSAYKFTSHILDTTLRNPETAEALYAALYILYETLEEPADRYLETSEERMAA